MEAAGVPHDYTSAKTAATVLHDHGFAAFVIGGAVRDIWLNRRPKDFDLVTNATPVQIMAIPEFRVSKYKDTAQAFGVTRVWLAVGTETHELEVATFRKDLEAHKGRRATKIAFAELEDDVLRRDFTVNALALDLGSNFIIDYVGGIDDLERRYIRFIGRPAARIREDPLRIMRAIRFKNHLAFTYHPRTVSAIKQAVAEGCIEAIAVDRLRDELTKLLTHPSRRRAFQDLDDFGILQRVLPEVTAGKRVAQPPEYHAEGTVWRHELLILDCLPDNPSVRLAWAALLHDIGKGPTTIKPLSRGGRIRFDRHYAVGAELAKAVMRRLKFSNHDIKDVTWMIYYHMAIDDLPHMRPSHQQRMLGHPAFADLLELHKADAAASWRPQQRRGVKPAFTAVEQLWNDYQAKPPAEQQPSLKRDLGIDGNWLLATFGKGFGLQSGPVIGHILHELDEWYRNERVCDQSAYKKKARQLLKNHTGHT